jgi:hypothetical protein
MARETRRRLAAPVRKVEGEIPAIHDRRATDLLQNAVVAPITVDDPHALNPGDKIVVMRSLRDDPLGAMHASNQIDEAQYMAGRHWQKAFELSEVGGAKAIDPTREAVDGGQIAQSSITDSQRRAFADLIKASRALGMEGEAIVRDILGRHMTVALTAAKRGLHGERERLYIGRRFREALETLAQTFGYVRRGA